MLKYYAFFLNFVKFIMQLLDDPVPTALPEYTDLVEENILL